MLVIKNSYLLTKTLLALYVFRFVVIAGSESYSVNYTFFGELAVLGFLFDVITRMNRISLSPLRIIVPYFMFILLLFVSMIWYPNGSGYMFDILTKYLLFFIGFFVIASTNNFDFLFYALILGCCSIFVLGYDEIREYMLDPVNRRFTFNSMDEKGGINPNSLAFYCNLSIAFLIYKFRLINKKYVRLGILSLIGLFIFFIVYVTLSRKGIIGIGIMYMFFIASGKKVSVGFKISIILGSVVGIFFLLQYLQLPIINRFISTINLFEGSQDIGQSDNERSLLIFESLKFWLDAPIFGNGISHFENNSRLGVYTHINYGELLTNYGLVGLVLFYGPIIKKVRALYRNYNHISYEVKFFFFVSMFLLISDFAMVSYNNIVYLLILAVILGYNFDLKGK